MRRLMTGAVAMALGAGAVCANGQIRIERNFENQIIEIQAQADAAAEAHRAAVEKRFVLRSDGRVKKEKAAFLGVVTTPVSPAMREQLKLRRGVGLVVERVEKDSPAEAAGIKQYDVVEKLNDQWLINTQQLSVLVRTFNPGDQITVSLLRQGQPQSVTAKLVEKELAVLDSGNVWGIASGDVFPENFVAPQGTIEWKGMLDANLPLIGQTLDANQSMTMSMSDDEHTLTMTVRDGKKHLTATDKGGNVVFNGPIDTDEQRKTLPPELADKVTKLQSKPNVIRMKLDRLRDSTTREGNN